MSNLSELLPAGAGDKSATFVASGTLSSGVTVALKSNGQVEVVTSSVIADNLGSVGTFDTNSVYNINAVYDSGSNKIIIAYRDGGSSYYGRIVVGTISSTSITFGSAPYLAGAQETNPISLAYDANAQKVLATYKASSTNYGYAVVCTVSGSSITVDATPYVFHSASTSSIAAMYSPVDQKTVIAYYGTSGYGYARVATISGTSVSFGTESQLSTLEGFSQSVSCYDSTLQKVIVAYIRNSSTPLGAAKVCTVSGTNITFGSEAVFKASAIRETSRMSIVYDSGANKLIIFYVDTSAYPRYRVGEVSGTTITYGSDTVIRSATTYQIAASYNSAANKTVYVWQDPGGSGHGKLQVATLSGTTLTFASDITYNSGSTDYPYAVYDSNAQKTAVIYLDGSNTDGATKVFTTGYTQTNNTSFIGITDEAISSGASGAVIVQGGVNSKVTSLTIGSDYYVQTNGTLSTTTSTVPAGRALTNSSILLEG